ncbi:tyrosine-type recombinase/integrase [Azospirillum doebereinerae]|uniref:tyrosine-type recombinase/integrase n=1 Tax=Azospirillum doebereinerae TaxID=92933 RepID=UPI00163BE96E|nr:site-specific integrase [Azospirillum doebereinerae]MCG5238671.1 site-specific integrase [Azospirillum doebereinerae]
MIDIVCQKICHRPISQIRPREVLELLQEIEKTGRLETARRAKTIIGGVFRLAALTDRAPTDPTVVLRNATKAPKVTHRAAIIQPDRFGELLRAIDGYEWGPSIKCALQALALTFVRPGELRQCMWKDIDLEDGIWRIPASTTKMKRPLDVPITPQLRVILREISPYSRKDSFVFPSPQSFYKPMGSHGLRAALIRLGFGEEMTAHGFRASASSMLNELGYRPDVIEMQLGHIEKNDVRREYNRALYWDERVAMMSEWAK